MFHIVATRDFLAEGRFKTVKGQRLASFNTKSGAEAHRRRMISNGYNAADLNVEG